MKNLSNLAEAREVNAEEHWAKKGRVDLYLYRKRPTGAGTLPLLFLVHGSSFSGRTGYDLQVPERSGYSMMDVFAGLGFDVWTMDHEGYGRSGSGGGNSDIASGVADLEAALEVIEKQTGQTACAFYGQSSGAIRAAAFAAANRKKAIKLALAAFVWTGEGSPTLAKRRERLEEWRSNNTRPVDAAFFHGMFTRDGTGYHDPAVPEAIAAAERLFGGTVPTGTYLDMCANLPLVDPLKISCPVLMIRGEFDGIAGEDDLIAFFSALPNKDKQFAFLPGQAHATQLGLNRWRFFHLLHGFLTMPDRKEV
ncbi:MAG: alpha/beta hydrolase [Gammaproteobacteria bacterium]|nr:alpha/beta hydrolase [Gammaproteobacteria bacterium]